MISIWLALVTLRVCVGSAESVLALVGDDVVLPCVLKPNVSAVDQLVEWTRPDLGVRSLHFYRDGRDSLQDQHATYRGRTAMFSEEMKMGNVSVKLSRVQLSDAGEYKCYLPKYHKQETWLTLDVGAASLPDISIRGTRDFGVVLQCESEGWYPEPEVEWLDSEGHVLSAGPTETVKDPDGTYTVRHQVTVYQTVTNRFTCRVQQQNITQTRETEIHVPGEIFPFALWKRVAIGMALLLVISIGIAICCQCRKQTKSAHAHGKERIELLEQMVVADLRIVLLGKTGAGRSASGNTILGRKAFQSKRLPAAVPLPSSSTIKHCEKARGLVEGKEVCVIDTPGLFASSFGEDEMRKCIEFSPPGPHIFLLVIPAVRYSRAEKDLVQNLQNMFGKKVCRFTMILFTHGDQLDGDSIEDELKNNSELEGLVDRCGGHYHLFNNKVKGRAQVSELLGKINDMVEQNQYEHYTLEMWKTREGGGNECLKEEKVEQNVNGIE